MFKNKKLLITECTGSFGNAVLQAFLDTGIEEIRIFSRDEKSRMTCGICIVMTNLNQKNKSLAEAVHDS